MRRARAARSKSRPVARRPSTGGGRPPAPHRAIVSRRQRAPARFSRISSRRSTPAARRGCDGREGRRSVALVEAIYAVVAQRPAGGRHSRSGPRTSRSGSDGRATRSRRTSTTHDPDVAPRRRPRCKSLGVAAGALRRWRRSSSEAGTAAFAADQPAPAPRRSCEFFTRAQYADGRRARPRRSSRPTTIRPARTPPASPTTSISCSANRLPTLKTPGPTASPRSTREPERFKAPFVKATAAQQIALADRDQPGTRSIPQTPLETFFVEAKDATIRGYYTSEIGIHKELPLQGQSVPAASSSAVRRARRATSRRRLTRRAQRHAAVRRSGVASRPSRRAAASRASRGDHARHAALRRHRRRLRRRRRHGRLPAGDRRRQGAAARGRHVCIDTSKEYRTMEWPYQTRAARPPPEPTSTRSNAAEYNMLDRPYGDHAAAGRIQEGAMAYSGNHFTRNWSSTRRRTRLTGTPYAWVRARVARRQDQPVGPRLAALLGARISRASRTTASARTGRSATPTSSPYYDQVDALLGIIGHEGEPAAAARRHLSARR